MSVKREDIEALPGFLRWSTFGEEGSPRPPVTYANAIIECSFSQELTPSDDALVTKFLAENGPKDDSYLWDGSQKGWRLEETGRTAGRAYRIAREVGRRRKILILENEADHDRIVRRMLEAGVPIVPRANGK